jgi:hypothetical protein
MLHSRRQNTSFSLSGSSVAAVSSAGFASRNKMRRVTKESGHCGRVAAPAIVALAASLSVALPGARGQTCSAQEAETAMRADSELAAFAGPLSGCSLRVICHDFTHHGGDMIVAERCGSGGYLDFYLFAPSPSGSWKLRWGLPATLRVIKVALSLARTQEI